MDLAADQASAKLFRLNREETSLKSRIANDTSRLELIAHEKAVLEPIVAKAAQVEASQAESPKTKRNATTPAS